MGTAADRVVYVGTADGLYEARPNGDGYQSRLLGLKGNGAIRLSVVIDNEDPRRLYVGTNQDGVFISEDGGETWRESNRGIRYKEVWSLVQHPWTGELYCGTGPSSVFKSTDRGETWTDCSATLRTMPETKQWTFPGPPYLSHVKSLAICPDDPDHVVGAIEEGWVIRSRDGGQTWQNIKEGVHLDAHAVTWAPDDPGILYVTTGRGHFRGEHGGDYYEEANEGLDRRYLAQVVVHPDRPEVLYTAGAAVPPPSWRRPQGADCGFYRSENRGQTWHQLSGGMPELLKPAPRAMAGDPADKDMVVVGLMDGSLWESTDGGESFRSVLEGLPSIGGLVVTHR